MKDTTYSFTQERLGPTPVDINYNYSNSAKTGKEDFVVAEMLQRVWTIKAKLLTDQITGKAQVLTKIDGTVPNSREDWKS